MVILGVGFICLADTQSSALQSQHYFAVYHLSLHVPVAGYLGNGQRSAGENGGSAGGSVGGHVSGIAAFANLDSNRLSIKLELGGSCGCGKGRYGQQADNHTQRQKQTDEFLLHNVILLLH